MVTPDETVVGAGSLTSEGVGQGQGDTAARNSAGQEAVPEVKQAVKTEAEGLSLPATEAGGAEEKVLTLTERELRSLLDREVTKALQTRTKKLQRELEEARAQLEEYRQKLEEGDLTLAAKLELREREVSTIKEQVKALKAQYDKLHEELEKLVEDELNSLSEEDRAIAEKAFPEDAPALLKLKVLRALKNAGKLSSGSASVERGGPGNIGTTVRVPPQAAGGTVVSGGGKGKGGNTLFERLFALGQSLAKERGGRSEGYVPPQWEGR